MNFPPRYEARLLWNDIGHMYNPLADRGRFDERFIVSPKTERQVVIDFCDLLWEINVLSWGSCKIGTMNESSKNMYRNFMTSEQPHLGEVAEGEKWLVTNMFKNVLKKINRLWGVDGVFLSRPPVPNYLVVTFQITTQSLILTISAQPIAQSYY